MKIIYGTNNKSKIEHMNTMLEKTSFEVIGLKDIDIPLTEPIEDGTTPLENATLKAKGYYNQIKRPVYSTDSGLYFKNVQPEDQPGVFIKRIHGKNLQGRDFTNYYANLAKKYGGRITAYYKNAICLIIDEQTIFTYDGPQINSEEFYIVDTPHPKHEEGFPLNAISVQISSGKYYNDITNYKAKGQMDEGFVHFFENVLTTLKNNG